MPPSQQHNPTAPPALAGASGYNAALDGVRGLAIFGVLWHHSNTILEPGNAIDRWFVRCTEFGGAGVDLFFVLSGFLITGILYDSKRGYDLTPDRYFGNFYARRALRIFPLYYAALFVWCVLLPHIGDILSHLHLTHVPDAVQAKTDRALGLDDSPVWFWLYLSNIRMAWAGKHLGGPLGVSWSLAIEEQFYLVWPLLVYFLSRKAMLRVCVGAFVLAFVSRLAITLSYTARGPLPLLNPLAASVLTMCRIDTLAIGAAIALALRGSVSLQDVAKNARRALPVALALAIGVMIFDANIFSGYGDPEHPGSGPAFIVLGLTLTAIVAASMLVLAVVTRPGTFWHWFWTNRFIRVLGKYAYGLYMLHSFIHPAFRYMLFGAENVEGGHQLPLVAGSAIPARVVYFLVLLALYVGAAWCSWTFFENPILKLKRFFPSGCEPHKR